MSKKYKLAEALLLRKQLESKVQQLQPIKQIGEQGLFEVKTERRNVSDNIDEIKFQLPKVELSSVTAEYDKYATALRKIDSAIQQTNWTAELENFTDSDNPFEK